MMLDDASVWMYSVWRETFVIQELINGLFVSLLLDEQQNGCLDKLVYEVLGIVLGFLQTVYGVWQERFFSG